jgi:hypothetical protein
VLHYPIRASGMGVFQFFLNVTAQVPVDSGIDGARLTRRQDLVRVRDAHRALQYRLEDVHA